MRHLLTAVLTLAATLTCNSAWAETETKIAKKDLPAAVLTAFETAYPKAHFESCATEPKGGVTFYEIQSKENGMERDLLYAADGTVQEVEDAMPVKDLPEAVRAAVAKSDPKAKIVAAEKVTRGKRIDYGVDLKGGKELLLDADGKPAGE